MRVLFMHNNFPAQFRNIAGRLGQNPENEVVYVTAGESWEIPGVKKAMYKTERAVSPQTHLFGRTFERAVITGEAAYRTMRDLREQGFVPDVVMAHSGWGPGLFVKDVWPETKFIGYFEWYYNARNADADFLPDEPMSEADVMRLRSKNAPILMDLAVSEVGVSPTEWQRNQFPAALRPRVGVLHDGVDTRFFSPDPEAVVEVDGVRLTAADQVITYVARGMEQYRGFPQFMRAASELQKLYPKAHVVIVGQDRVAYGRSLPNGQTYKQKMLADLDFDMSRLHFTGLLPYGEYLKVIRISSAHVYLTVPFVLSWSMLETMSVGGLIVGSRTPPVQEVIRDRENGILVDFFSQEELVNAVGEALEHPERMTDIRQRARRTIVEKYELGTILARQENLLRAVARGLPQNAGPKRGGA